MAVLPTQLSDSLPTPIPQRTVQGYDSQAVPQAQVQQGEAEQHIADQMARVTQIQAGQALVQKKNDYDQDATTFLYGDGTPNNPGLMSLKGAQAADAMKKYQAWNTTATATAMDGISNPYYQNQLKAELQAASISHQREIGQHVVEQTRAYTGDLMLKSQDLLQQQAALHAQDNDFVDAQMAASDKNMANIAKLAGAVPGDAIYQDTMVNGRSALYKTQINALLSSKDLTQQAMGVQRFDAVKNEMSAEAIQTLDPVVTAARMGVAERAAAQDIVTKAGTANMPTEQIDQAVSSAPLNLQEGIKRNLLAMKEQAQAQQTNFITNVGGKAMQDISQGVHYDNMTPQDQVNLDKAGLTDWVKNYNPTAPSDTSIKAAAYAMDPKTLAATNIKADPSLMFGLSPPDRQQLINRQQSLSDPQALAAQENLHAIVKSDFARIGVDVSQFQNVADIGKGGEKAQLYTHVMDLLNINMAAYAAQHNGQTPPPAELRKMADQVITNTPVKSVTPKAYLNYFDANYSNKPYEMAVSDLPPEFIKEWTDKFKSQGVNPTDNDLINAYINKYSGK